jgi:chromosomal replication initiation ATPase DnaA
LTSIRHGDGTPRTETVAAAPMSERDGAVAERSLELCECMLDIVSAMFNVSGRELRRPGRSSLAVSRVRQIAMYVCHVVLGLGMREIGCGFGRDRTTVLHACQVVEDLRDDRDFDSIVVAVERVAAAALRFQGEAGR